MSFFAINAAGSTSGSDGYPVRADKECDPPVDRSHNQACARCAEMILEYPSAHSLASRSRLTDDTRATLPVSPCNNRSTVCPLKTIPYRFDRCNAKLAILQRVGADPGNLDQHS